MVKLLAVEGAGEQNLIYDECQKRNHMTNYVTAQFQSHLHVEGFFFFFQACVWGAIFLVCLIIVSFINFFFLSTFQLTGGNNRNGQNEE